jgi:DNA oxidative demethylase
MSMQGLRAPAGTAASAPVPGFTGLRRYLDDVAQRVLASEIAEIVSLAPWFLPRMRRSGRTFSVKMTNYGRLGWVRPRRRLPLSGDASGYRECVAHHSFVRADPMARVGLLAHPEVCPVNFYDFSARMGLQEEQEEADLAAPWSQSRSATVALYRYGGLRRGGPAMKLELRSGHIVVVGGAAWLMFHGVDKIFADSSGLLRVADGSISPCGG